MGKLEEPARQINGDCLFLLCIYDIVFYLTNNVALLRLRVRICCDIV